MTNPAPPGPRHFFACPACACACSAYELPEKPECRACASAIPVSDATVGQPPAELTRLIEDLTRLRVLPRGAGVHLAGGVGRYPSPAAVLAELARIGWLTPWQAERLREGKGGSLVMGQYVLLDRLGGGGMGEVFEARHALMDRVVALKVMRSGDLERFRREIRGLSRLAHPNVVVAHDAGESDGVLFLVTELVPGTDLARLVAERGPLPYAEARELARQAALALAHVHACGMVHRDIKPHNLMAARDDRGRAAVKLLDLGLVRMREGGDDITGDGAIMGTLDYIAPEQAEDSKNADIRADLYSLGCTLYFLLTGRPPFAGGSITEKIAGHREREPTPVERVRPDCPPALAAVVRRLMAKRPRDRFQTPAEVVEALAAPPADDSPTEPFAPPPSRRAGVPLGRLLVGVVALGMLALAAVLAWRFWPAAGAPPDPGPGPVAKGRPRPDRVGELFRWQARRFDLSASGRGLCLGDEAALVVDLFDGQVVRKFAPAGWGRLSPDGKRVFLADGGLPFKCRLVRVDDGGQEWDFGGISPALFQGAFSSDGKRLALAHERRIVVFDLDARKEAAGMAGHEAGVSEMAFCLGDRRLVTGGKERTVRLWDAATGKELAREAGMLPTAIDTHLLNADRTACLVSDKGEGLLVRGIEPWKTLFRLPGQGMARIGEGGRVVAFTAGAVTFWDAGGGPLGRRPSPAGNIHSVAISPDGKRALTGHRLGEVLLWDVDAEAAAAPTELKGHKWGIDRIDFLDAHRAVTHSADGVVIVWGLP